MGREPRGIKADEAFSYSKLERLASGFRKHLGLEPTTRLAGLELYDNLPNTVVNGVPYKVECSVDHLNGVEAEASFNAERGRYQLLLTPETYELLESGNPHGTWVMVHEYAHVALHGRLLQRLAKMELSRKAALYKGSPVPHPFYMDTEWQTDSFTAAALMPAAGIAHFEENPIRVFGQALSLVRCVTTRFGTSQEAAQYRIDTFKRRREELLSA